MLSSLISSIEPAGFVLVGAGLGSLLFSGPLARIDGILESAGLAKVDTEHSKKWVEVAGAAWGVIGIALLFASRFLG